jgi:hypothetical protein
MASPVPFPALRPKPCLVFTLWHMQTSDWSRCSDRCLTKGGTYKSRVVQCVETSATGSQSVAVITMCRGQTTPETVMECDTSPCLGPLWLAANDWGACSQPCIANVSDPRSLGLSTSSAPRCVQVTNGTVVAAPSAQCGPQTLVTERPCNRFLCPGTVLSWTVGAWGPCVPSAPQVSAPSSPAPCTATVGVQSRIVQRTNVAGVVQPDTACLTYGPSVAKPASATVCVLEAPCGCTLDAHCGSGRWACNMSTRSCQCGSGWAGADCSIPLVSPVSGQPACDGIVDMAGNCCADYVDIYTGLCCPGNQVLDATGRCCPSGRVDACGVCNGKGVAVDSVGICCESALPPSGMCCAGAAVDSCGVCGGSNLCR